MVTYVMTSSNRKNVFLLLMLGFVNLPQLICISFEYPPVN